MRDLVILACEKCKRRNYNTDKNKRKHTARVAYKKYCPFCNSHTIHKETR